MKTRLVLFLILPVLLFASPSFAYNILSGGADNSVYFANQELLFDIDGNQVDLGTVEGIARGVKVGDVFMGIINAQNVNVAGATYWNSLSTIPGFNRNVSGIFAQEVTKVQPITGEYSALITMGNTTRFDFTLSDATTVDISSVLAAGEMMAFYVDYDTDGDFSAYKTNGTIQDDIGVATDSESGTAWLTAGLVETTDYSYSYTTLGTALGEFSAEAYAGLSIMTNNTGFNIFELVNDQGEDLYNTDVGLAFTSEIEKNQDYPGNSPWQITSNDPAFMHPVPEPTTFLLLGAGLMGLGYYSRKRRK